MDEIAPNLTQQRHQVKAKNGTPTFSCDIARAVSRDIQANRKGRPRRALAVGVWPVLADPRASGAPPTAGMSAAASLLRGWFVANCSTAPRAVHPYDAARDGGVITALPRCQLRASKSAHAPRAAENQPTPRARIHARLRQHRRVVVRPTSHLPRTVRLGKMPAAGVLRWQVRRRSPRPLQPRPERVVA
jgi:hypothetical protein